MENKWDLCARHYDTLRLLPSYQSFQDDIVRNLVSSLKKMQDHNHLNILDIGCGTGNFIEIFLGGIKDFHENNIRVFGIDNSKEMLKIAKIKLGDDQRVNFIEGDVDKIIETLPPSSYQAVVMNNALYNLKNPLKVFFQIANILSVNGILIISDPKPDFRYSRIFLNCLRSLRFLIIIPKIAGSLWWIYLHNRRAIDGAQSQFYTVDEIKGFLNETELDVTKIEETYAKQNFLITAIKK